MTLSSDADALRSETDACIAALRSCRLCAEKFRATASAHEPRPVAWFAPEARVLIAGQAPGVRVHRSGRPFTDPSGDRLRDWLAVDAATFYDRRRIAIVPMAFCFPGHDARGGDLPPPKLCARTWRARVMALLPNLRMVLAVGAVAQGWHIGPGSVTGRVANWRSPAARGIWPLPHPSWRNSGWLARNPWFEAELLPELRRSFHDALEADP